VQTDSFACGIEAKHAGVSYHYYHVWPTNVNLASAEQFNRYNRYVGFHKKEALNDEQNYNANHH
jgi:hypothetical protein